MQFIDLSAQQARIKDRLDMRVQEVMAHGNYIMGPEVKELEDQLAAFCGAKHCITCANGTDALQLALMILNVGAGDAVFVPSFTFASTIEVIPLLGATPVLVDIDRDTFNMDPESLERAIAHARARGFTPRIIIPVDLFGLPADYDTINAIAAREGLEVIADSAQGFGGTIDGRMTGILGDITTTSFFPAKPLGCYGDGGALFTDNDDWAALLDSIRFHGRGAEKYDNVRIGVNSRLDTLQAAILLEKLAIYADEIEARQRVAGGYTQRLSGTFKTPHIPKKFRSVWAQYTLTMEPEQRNEAAQRAKAADVPTMIYYPKALHQQTAYRDSLRDPAGLPVSEEIVSQVLCLPMHPYLSEAEQDRVVAAMLNE